MSLFISSKEKRLWFWVLTVLLAILGTLLMGRPLANQLRDQNVQAVFFVFGMLFVASAIIIHAVKNSPGKFEWSVLLGLIAVYVMFIFRLGAPERSHLIEYSVLAILIHKALIERFQSTKNTLKTGLLALITSFLIGVIDESIQWFLPNRVFDPADILFNGMAVTFAISGNVLITWARKRKKDK